MVRSSTPLLNRNSPVFSRKEAQKKGAHLKNDFLKPTVERHQLDKSPFKHRQIRHSPYARLELGAKNKLETIVEEPSFEGDDTHNISTTLTIKDLKPEELSDDDNASSQDSDFDGWDDETTLVSKFQESMPETSEQERLVELANQLEGPMEARSEILKQYLAHTIAPAARKVKSVHNALEEKFDVTFGVAVLSFDDACKRVERPALRDEEELRRLFSQTQQNIEEIFKKLQAAYQTRELLWEKLQASVEECASKAQTNLDTLSTDLEESIANVEKKAKEMTKTSGIDGKAKQKLLRELLADV